MNPLQRRKFIHLLLLSGLSQTSFARALSKWIGNQVGNMKNMLPHSSDITITDASVIVDIHCHPNMKAYLLDLDMWRYHMAEAGENKFNMQVDIAHLKQGNVKGFLASHHLPERGMREQAYTFRRLMPFIHAIAPVFVTKLENGDASNFRQLTTMIDDFEAHIEKANNKNGGGLIRIAKSYADFEKTFGEGMIAVAQSVEGGHCLGRDVTWEIYKERIDFLAARGICSFTLSHFFTNDFSHPTEGLSPHEKKILKLAWNYNPAYDDRPLTELGRKAVCRLLQKGIIVDLTHMNPNARAEVFELNKKYRRPIVFTHTGVQKLYKDVPQKMEPFKLYAADDTEIQAIKDCNGVIGIAFMNFWLIGQDVHNHNPGTKRCDFKKGITNIINTIKYIREKTGTYENIALGSDFDGFADAPTDLKHPGYYPQLVAEIKKTIDTTSGVPITEAEVRMITHGNALRVLKQGWGNPSPEDQHCPS